MDIELKKYAYLMQKIKVFFKSLSQVKKEREEATLESKSRNRESGKIDLAFD